MIKNLLVLLTLIISEQTFCCDCKNLKPLDSLRNISYNQSEIVFLGELIDYNTIENSFTFKIIELFKGEIKSIFIKGKSFDSCSTFPMDKCKWIVYANFQESDYISINQCGASRSENNPICINCYEIPGPTELSGKSNEDDEFNKKIKLIKEKAVVDWNEEIILLRSKK